jgi:inosine-uridine nucleoside N-ribohydrolase
VTHKILTSDARLQQIAALDNNASKLVGDILSEYIKGDMEYFGIPGGPVHDATVIAYLLKPELFSGRHVNVVVDSREGRPSVKPLSTGITASGRRRMRSGWTAATPRDSSIC